MGPPTDGVTERQLRGNIMGTFLKQYCGCLVLLHFVVELLLAVK